MKSDDASYVNGRDGETSEMVGVRRREMPTQQQLLEEHHSLELDLLKSGVPREDRGPQSDVRAVGER